MVIVLAEQGCEFSPCLGQNLSGLGITCTPRKIKCMSGLFGQSWLDLGKLSCSLLP